VSAASSGFSRPVLWGRDEGAPWKQPQLKTGPHILCFCL
jgi:hypothetical protein